MPVWIDCVCENCGKPFQRERFNHNWAKKNGRRLMCSRECVKQGNIGAGNGVAHTKGPRWQASKASVVRERGNECQLCGWNKDAVDACHIMDRADGGTDAPDNLILMCPNDHRLFDHNLLSVADLSKLEASMTSFGYTITLRKED